jgi:uncharacterized protein (TIGR02246 family)
MAHTPEDWPREFERHMNAGEVDAAAALYAPDASVVTLAGETVVGRASIRRMLAGLVEDKARLEGRVAKVVTTGSGDVAILYTDWQLSAKDAAGKPIERRTKALEVLRHQADGSWTLVLGDPNGRG